MKKWFKKIHIKRSLLLIPAVLVFLFLMGFVSSELEDKVCRNIYVHIDFGEDNYFVNQSEVLALMTQNDRENLLGAPVDNINLKELEERVKTHNFVKEAQVFKDYKGNLTVTVKQCRPIARIIDQDGLDAYVDSDGNLLPSSETFTARVLLISGPFSDNMKNEKFLKSEEGKPYIDLLNFIDQNSFWKAQLAQMVIDKSGDISFLPQIGDQCIQFGEPREVERKFNKLRIFYTKIFALKGYNHYDRVCVKYKDQIICE